MQDFNELEGIETHIPLMDSYGNIEMIDRAKAPLAIQKHGYTLPSEEQLHKLVLEKKFGDNSGSELRAFAEGAARTATLGGSDLLQTKLLGVPGEEIEARRELNPNASFAGDIAGIALPLPTGKLGALGKTLEYLMPLKAAEKLGAKVTEAAAPRVGKLVGSLVNAEKRPIANEILTQAGAHGLGSVIPGMAFGAGETVTEYALGDPGLNAEKALANIGYSGAFAGAFGAAFGGVKGALDANSFLKHSPTSPSNSSLIDSSDSLEQSINNFAVSEAEKKNLINKLTELKPNAPELFSDAERLGVKLMEGQYLSNEQIQRFESTVMDSPTVSGAKRLSQYQDQYEKLSERVRSILKSDIDYSKAELGQSLQDSISQKFIDKSAPIHKLYEEFEKQGRVIPIGDELKSSIKDQILRSEKGKFNQGIKLAEQYASEIDGVVKDGIRKGGIHNVKDIKELKTYIYDSLPGIPDKLQKNMAAEVYDILTNAEEKAILKEASNTFSKEQMTDLIALRKHANAEYKELIKLADPILKLFGRKKTFQGPMNFVNFITNEVTPEKFADALFNSKKNTKFLEFFKQQFPEEVSLLSQAEKSKFYDKILKTDLNKNLFEQINKLPKEYKEIIFSASELEDLRATQNLLTSFPKPVGPSGTPRGQKYNSLFSVSGLLRNAGDALTVAGIKAAGRSSEAASLGPVKELTKLESFTKKITDGIKIGSKSIFEGSERMSPYVASNLATTDKKDEESSFEARIKDVSSLANNPELLLETISDKTQSIYSFAPDTSGSLAQALAAGNQFLNSKIPQQTPSSGLMFAMKPSFLDIKTFNNYVEILDAPLKALRHVKYGTLTNQTMETLTQVYPKLLAEMQQAVMSQMIDYSAKLAKGLVPPLPYQTLMSVSSFLGQPLDGSLSPDQILQTQATISANAARQAQVEAQQKANLTAGTKRGPASRMMTPGQQGLYRRD